MARRPEPLSSRDSSSMVSKQLLVSDREPGGAPVAAWRASLLSISVPLEKGRGALGEPWFWSLTAGLGSVGLASWGDPEVIDPETCSGRTFLALSALACANRAAAFSFALNFVRTPFV